MTADDPPGPVLPDVDRLLQRYDDLLRAATTNDASCGGLRRVPGVSLQLTAHAVRHVDRVLSALASYYRRQHALTANAAHNNRAEQIEQFRSGLPGTGPVKTVALVLVATFLILAPLVDRVAGPSVVDVASAAVRLDGAEIATALRSSDPSALLFALFPIALLATVLATPTVLGSLGLRNLLKQDGRGQPDGAATTAALESATLTALGLAAPRPWLLDPLNLAPATASFFIVLLGFLTVQVQDAEQGRPTWMIVFPALLVAVVVGAAVAKSARDGEGWSTRQTAVVFVISLVAVTLGAARMVDWLTLRGQPAFDLEAVEIAEHGVVLADFLDQAGSADADQPVPTDLNLVAYQRDRQQPEEEVALRRLPGMVVSWEAATYGSVYCNCAIVAHILDAATLRPLPGDWNATRWPVTYRKVGDDMAQGDIWLPTPDVPGTYVVQLEIARTRVVTERSALKENREFDGPLQLVLRNGDKAGKPVYQELVRLTGRQSDPFLVPLVKP